MMVFFSSMFLSLKTMFFKSLEGNAISEFSPMLYTHESATSCALLSCGRLLVSADVHLQNHF